MGNKSLFAKTMLIIIVALICLVLTVAVALLLGAQSGDIFDFSNLNLSNMIPVILIGGFISSVIVGILVLILAKDVLIKLKDYFFKENDGGKEK